MHDIVHQDLKGVNILITSTNWRKLKLVIGDLGVATHVGSQKFFGYGTRFYQPPEIITGRQRDPQFTQDIYALGMILAELVAPDLQTKFKCHFPDGFTKQCFEKLMNTINAHFWEEFGGKITAVLMMLLKPNPNNRITLAEFKLKFNKEIDNYNPKYHSGGLKLED